MKKMIEEMKEVDARWFIFPFLLLAVGAMAIYALAMEAQEKWQQFKWRLTS